MKSTELIISNNDYSENLSDITGLYNNSYYNPILKKIFNINNNNNESYILNSNTYFTNFKSKIDMNNYIINTNKNYEKRTFIKFCPLLDPLKYLTGEYKKKDILKTPKYNYENNDDIQIKINNYNNSAYVDGFFSYLSSTLLNSHDFVHGVEFYGMVPGIKNNFILNVTDDLEYLMESDYFINNKENNHKLLGDVEIEISNTRKNKKKIKINDDEIILTTNKLDDYGDLFIDNNNNKENNNNEELIFEYNIKNNDESGDENSNDEISGDESCDDESGDENSNDESSGEESGGEENGNEISDNESSDEESGSENSDDEDDYDEDEEISCEINKFPTVLVSLECLENTLDNYIENNEITNNEWKSILFQIVITLCTYQDKFDFYHNDLHTSNIMYITTEKEYLLYTYDNIMYKVPTYGKIYKIIDFGRGIYKYKNHTLFSDSFDKNNDAYGQYNCQPFYNKNKEIVNPNKSFDLVRLGCSLFDYFFENIKHSNEKYLSEVEEIIKFWCLDDKNKNILYKDNNRDRYPDFKLYKMISRTVHNKSPKEQLSNKIFKSFIIKDNEPNINTNIIDIDKIPKYY